MIVNMFGNKLKIFIALALINTASFAQSFNASVNSTTIGLNDQLQVSFTFSGQDINGIKSFSPPQFYNFMILSGPNQSTSMQIINSAVSASMTYSYYLQPKNIGKFTIGSASVNYNGKEFKSNPINITVVKGAPKPQ